jgi:hypothetical protein
MASVALLFLTSAASADSEASGLKDVKALAERIDSRIEAGWRAQQAKPAAAADDATFLRRVYLDLVGQVPALTDARDFLDDPAPDKRTRLVERLLATDAHARHFSTTWRKILGLDVAQFFTGPGSAQDVWFQRQVRENVPYDQFTREILVGKAPGLNALLGNMPVDQAATAARVFLGVRLECAQCHDHPFAKWKKQQFWEFAAFFNRGQIEIPNTSKVAKARFLVGDTAKLEADGDPRALLADWATGKTNPFFAQAAVNRLWMHFFGIGLVDPVDSLGEDHPASHPELLDDLAQAFAARKFDVRFLIQAITASKAYRLGSVASDDSQKDQRLFARAVVRGLTAQQLYDSLAVATGKGIPLDGGAIEATPFKAFGARNEFVARFAEQGKPLEAETSILQALHLMNGQPMADATSLQENRLLQTIADAKGLTMARRIEELFLLTLSRRPRAEESERLVKYADAGGARADKKMALADVYWVLLNSSEFCLNH